MSAQSEALEAHLASGLTTVCRCWVIRRADGVVQGFTDHDQPLSFDGIAFSANAGLSAAALQQSTGLSVDNTEAVGALSDFAISEQDLHGGRYDNAEVEIWLVNWADTEARKLSFRGTIGEVQQTDGAFRAELRGLAETLNQPQGRIYRADCTALLGDASCKLDIVAADFSVEVEIAEPTDGVLFHLPALGNFGARWFERGVVEVLSGQAAGLNRSVKNDRRMESRREVEVWESFTLPIVVGDRIRLVAGCDKRAETCRSKFKNFANFQGFPFMPGEDWLLSYPTSNTRNDGGSLV
ncbi:DUF2163 domain-containing protein [Tropicimonas sp. S265A]|uniref:DUF2163 domain-containing protein n=1 Tax=Tropicimonas sp. S265A TaxID=3415134 RepID=UPI003C7A99AE